MWRKPEFGRSTENNLISHLSQLNIKRFATESLIKTTERSRLSFKKSSNVSTNFEQVFAHELFNKQHHSFRTLFAVYFTALHQLLSYKMQCDAFRMTVSNVADYKFRNFHRPGVPQQVRRDASLPRHLTPAFTRRIMDRQSKPKTSSKLLRKSLPSSLPPTKILILTNFSPPLPAPDLKIDTDVKHAYLLARYS
jgi:hypothetical protein